MAILAFNGYYFISANRSILDKAHTDFARIDALTKDILRTENQKLSPIATSVMQSASLRSALHNKDRAVLDDLLEDLRDRHQLSAISIDFHGEHIEKVTVGGARITSEAVEKIGADELKLTVGLNVGEETLLAWKRQMGADFSVYKEGRYLAGTLKEEKLEEERELGVSLVTVDGENYFRDKFAIFSGSDLFVYLPYKQYLNALHGERNRILLFSLGVLVLGTFGSILYSIYRQAKVNS